MADLKHIIADLVNTQYELIAERDALKKRIVVLETELSKKSETPKEPA